MTAIIIDATRCALKAHGDQKYGDLPYMDHVLQVAALVAYYGGTEEEVVAAILHDVVEDTDETIGSIHVRFGPVVASLVEAVTKIDGEAPEDYLRRVVIYGGELIKACDSFVNLTNLRNPPMSDRRRAKLQQRYEHNLRELKPYLPRTLASAIEGVL